jgi:hypothetical protein
MRNSNYQQLLPKHKLKAKGETVFSGDKILLHVGQASNSHTYVAFDDNTGIYVTDESTGIKTTGWRLWLMKKWEEETATKIENLDVIYLRDAEHRRHMTYMGGMALDDGKYASARHFFQVEMCTEGDSDTDEEAADRTVLYRTDSEGERGSRSGSEEDEGEVGKNSRSARSSGGGASSGGGTGGGGQPTRRARRSRRKAKDRLPDLKHCDLISPGTLFRLRHLLTDTHVCSASGVSGDPTVLSFMPSDERYAKGRAVLVDTPLFLRLPRQGGWLTIQGEEEKKGATEGGGEGGDRKDDRSSGSSGSNGSMLFGGETRSWRTNVSRRFAEEDAFLAQIVPTKSMADFLFVYEKKRALADFVSDELSAPQTSAAAIAKARDVICGLIYFLGSAEGGTLSDCLQSGFYNQHTNPRKQQLFCEMGVIETLLTLLRDALQSKKFFPLCDEHAGEEMNTICRLAFACVCHTVCNNERVQLFVHRQTPFIALAKQYIEQVRTTVHEVELGGAIGNLNSWAMHAIDEVHKNNEELIRGVDEAECRYWLKLIEPSGSYQSLQSLQADGFPSYSASTCPIYDIILTFVCTTVARPMLRDTVVLTFIARHLEQVLPEYRVVADGRVEMVPLGATAFIDVEDMDVHASLAHCNSCSSVGIIARAAQGATQKELLAPLKERIPADVILAALKMGGALSKRFRSSLIAFLRKIHIEIAIDIHEATGDRHKSSNFSNTSKFQHLKTFLKRYLQYRCGLLQPNQKWEVDGDHGATTQATTTQEEEDAMDPQASFDMIVLLSTLVKERHFDDVELHNEIEPLLFEMLVPNDHSEMVLLEVVKLLVSGPQAQPVHTVF